MKKLLPITLFGVYRDMGWGYRSAFAVTTTVRNAHSSVGDIIASPARNAPIRYAIYSQVQPCDLSYRLPHMSVPWPILDVIGMEPSPDQRITALGGHQFGLNKLAQDDFYTPDALF